MLFPLIDELATTDIVSVPPRVAVRHALQKMSQHKVRNVVVEEASGGYGLLTASDVVRLRFSQLGLDTTIGDAGYHALPYIAKGSNLLDVIELFDDAHGYAAVIDESFLLHHLEQAQDRGVCQLLARRTFSGAGRAGVHRVGDLANGGLVAVPEHLERFELAIGGG